MKLRFEGFRARRLRRGFTLIELLVVISIIATLIALVTPAIQSARAAARRLQCLSNIAQLGKAVANYQSQSGDRFPALATATDGWPITLLPLLDSAALQRQIRDERVTNPSVRIQSAPGAVPALSLRIFTCPDDQNNFRVAGGLSYCANAGYMHATHWGAANDLDHKVGTVRWTSGAPLGAANNTIHLSTGIFWRSKSVDNADMRMTGDFISKGDGLSQTLLFAENVQAQNWGSISTGDIGFGISCAASTVSFRLNSSLSTGKIGASASPSPSTALELQTAAGWNLYDSLLNTVDNAAINARVGTATQGLAPRPSSQHTGGIVNFCFADGHAGALSDVISANVYARLLTTDGARYGEGIVDMGDAE